MSIDQECVACIGGDKPPPPPPSDHNDQRGGVPRPRPR